jgi:hypothetical protein
LDKEICMKKRYFAAVLEAQEAFSAPVLFNEEDEI